MKTGIIIQARMNSTRLYGKVMKKFSGLPIIGIILKRLSYSKEADKIIVATTKEKNGHKLINYLKKNKINYFIGSENDLLNRYIKAAEKFKIKYIVRVTADCPLIEPKIVDKCIRKIKKSKADYVCNVFPPTFPDGLDVDVMKIKTLKKLKNFSRDKLDLEHFPRIIKQNPKKFKIVNLKNKKDLSHIRLTVDEIEDYNLIKKIFKNFYPKVNFDLKSILSFYNKNKKLFKMNKHLKRNSGSNTPRGQKLWNRATKVIPGGNMLLSKNPNMYLPNKWPTYFNKTSGSYVWDLEGKKYIDMCTMGVGTNSLGYSNKLIDKEVIKVIKSGTLSTLNCPEEVTLAERLIQIHPWAEMARFTRTGGEANALAIRIARSSTQKHKIAFCGYHGWHDWYLSSTLKEKDNLKFHLFPDMQPKGLPPELKNTSFPFLYGDFDGLKKLCEKENIGIIKMEVCRNTKPNVLFLRKVKKLAVKKNIILIFDECTTGFRETLGGIHKKIKINPDMAIFGKALGNGYPINAIIGKKEIMENTQKTFASSTFWTERIGPVAAIKTLEIMEKKKSWEILTKKGNYIINGWKKIAYANNLKIKIYGIPSLAKFEIPSKNWMMYKTLITQELLKNNILATNTVYSCTEHSKKQIDHYLEKLSKVFKLISLCEDGRNINDYMDTISSFMPFNRLN
tara:strand:+ start:2434 stop:4464 length:2031 start_codon:yes stop_codon:yes gene_type:complete